VEPEAVGVSAEAARPVGQAAVDAVERLEAARACRLADDLLEIARV
jgi:hypothetical protein